MVHRMDSCHKVKVKTEGDDQAGAELLGPADKRLRLSGDTAPQSNLGSAAVVYNPLSEPSPLGLRLKKSPSLLELIQMRLSQEQTPKSSSLGGKTHKATAADKLKASNFPASLLKIGTWEYKSKYEGDLVAKCYFAKHKLVWEVLDGALKNKIEIQWSDIVAIKARYAVEGTDTIEVVLARQPLFFRETNPQPRKHTLWQPTADFTGGQASIYRHHLLHCSQGLLGRHFEKLVQCDPRLNFLSQQPEIALDSPYFEPKAPVFHEPTDSHCRFGLSAEGGSSLFENPGAVSQSGSHSSSSRNESQELLSTRPENYSSSPSSGDPHGLLCCHFHIHVHLSVETHPVFSVMDAGASEEIGGNLSIEPGFLGQRDQLRVPGIQPSMSMSDLVTHLGHCISEQKGFADTIFSADEQLNRDVLEEVARHFLSDSNISASSDEQFLMSRVDSFWSLLDPVAAKTHVGTPEIREGPTRMQEVDSRAGPSNPVSAFTSGPTRAMSRKDSVGEMLLNLPRIASLPRILPVLPEDSANGKR